MDGIKLLDMIEELEVHVKIYKNQLSALDLFMYLYYFFCEKWERELLLIVMCIAKTCYKNFFTLDRRNNWTPDSYWKVPLNQ